MALPQPLLLAPGPSVELIYLTEPAEGCPFFKISFYFTLRITFLLSGLLDTGLCMVWSVPGMGARKGVSQFEMWLHSSLIQSKSFQTLNVNKPVL